MLHAASKGHRVGIMSLEVPVESTFDMLAGMSAVVAQPTEQYLKEFAQWIDRDDKILLYETPRHDHASTKPASSDRSSEVYGG